VGLRRRVAGHVHAPEAGVTNDQARERITELSNKGMKQTSVERIGRSQLIPSVGPTWEARGCMRHTVLFGLAAAAVLAGCGAPTEGAGGKGTAGLPSPAAQRTHVSSPAPEANPSDDAYCHPEACRTGGVVRIVESVPTVLQRVKPEYPADALASGVQGPVVVEARVNQHGRVVSACVRSGPAPLRSAAAGAAMRWEYTRTRQVPAAVPYCVTATLTFDFSIPKRE